MKTSLMVNGDVDTFPDSVYGVRINAAKVIAQNLHSLSLLHSSETDYNNICHPR